MTFSQSTTQTHVNMARATQPPSCLTQLARPLPAPASERLSHQPAATTGARCQRPCGPRTRGTPSTPEYNQRHGRLHLEHTTVAQLLKRPPHPRYFMEHKVHFHIHKSLPHSLLPILRQMNPVHIIASCFLKLYFNDISIYAYVFQVAFLKFFTTICLQNTKYNTNYEITLVMAQQFYLRAGRHIVADMA